NFVCVANSEQAQKLFDLFNVAGWTIDNPPYTIFRAKIRKTFCTYYQSGKLLIQGGETALVINEFIATVCPELLSHSEPSPKKTSEIFFEPHIGIDESGKGDFFGPLVTAAVYVDENSAAELLKLGVKDSKIISNDSKIKSLANSITRICHGSYDVMVLNNEMYNRLYSKFGNLNKMLAWCHATALENVLKLQPHCKQAISDQFASSKSVLEGALKEQGRKIDLIQRTKAEEDIAVAAASILARAEFVRIMQNLSLQLQLATNLPKGASAKVKQVANELAQKYGKAFLLNYVKVHFKTFNEIDGEFE
ncbi:MAG: ribonuclease HIII, partial [Lentisphaeria bacterium]